MLPGFLALSIVVPSLVVNAAGSAVPEIARLVEYLTRHGTEAAIPQEFSKEIGLSGPSSVKSKDLIVKKSGKDFAGLGAMITLPAPGETAHVFLIQKAVKGDESVSRYIRLSQAGTADQVHVLRGKLDANGKSIRGSAVWSRMDPASTEAKRLVATELAQMKKWLKKELAAKKRKDSLRSE